MKRISCFLLIITILCTTVLPCFASNPTVSTSVPTATIGETITVSVNLSENSGLAGLQFVASFNNTEFQLVSNSAQASNMFSAIPVEKTSSVEYAGVSVNPVNAGGTVLSFKLKVLKTGGKISINVIDAINGENKRVTVSATGATVNCSHANAQWQVTKQATCVVKGTETKTCTCGHVETRDIAIIDHTVGTYKTVKNATCSEKGQQLATCSVCAKEFTKDVPVLNHNFDKWNIIKEATETQNGMKERSCKVCNHIEKVEIAKLASAQVVTDNNAEKPSETQTETETEANTTPQIQDNHTDDANTKPIVVGIVLFVVGVAIGIFATLFIIKRKSKEE